mmetsp:Transcript_33512/g.69751  ORF Transcript_33512/g.69751 Transcript_33512/m.69751 type:complete len:614 (-) Transcript_33512:329-2170(-)|eukprot:CAMPEP_0172459020 /NCGR_PEP_ID=MMETSP1065-20121228/30588_1 /TAXON_ID=265537 /ORGANISM="Amphiprora paludosa, Strain CCMP125" /LENGTH=613 /DNA_ID=CAMNT_0013213555 /DNA_START=37 /DNA_END=1878 /DNA_ORIENTATION=-
MFFLSKEWGCLTVVVIALQLLSALGFLTKQHPQPLRATGIVSNPLAVSSAVDSPLATASVASSLTSENDNGVEFPPPLSTVDRLKRSVEFWLTAVPVIANYYGLIGSIKLQEIMGTDLTPDQVEELWNKQHEDGAAKLANTITNLKGFYVKTAQIISSRQDLFPEQYTEALSVFTDNVDPMPASLAKAVVESELLHADERFEDVFSEFDETPLGAASVAQVHRAVLTEKYGGPREVAIKIQRPSIESKLLGDVANLKAIAKTFRDVPELPLDYYTVFAELEKQLADEFDFVAEAVAMDRIYNSLILAPDGVTQRDVPLVMPRPVAGLVSQRVLVMDYLKGVPLSRAREQMIEKGLDPDSPEAKLFARNLLTALTNVFGRNILETGFFHADPHPGNIFVLENGEVGLIDFGQVKQISGRNRETLCKIMVALDERKGDETPEDLATIGKLALELGVELNEDAQEEAAAAVGMWLFDGTVEKLPGGYDKGELSPNSPVRELKSFPQDLVLVGRSSILIKGLSNRLDIPWSLASQWAPIARSVLSSKYSTSSSEVGAKADTNRRVRFRQVWRTFKQWYKGRATGIVRRLPSPLRTKLAAVVVKMEERKSRRKLTRRD